MLQVFYSDKYNIDLGVFNHIHPFDGLKYEKVIKNIETFENLNINLLDKPISNTEIKLFVDALQSMLFERKSYIFRALEIPNIPFLSMSWIEEKLLMPFRWGVSGTLMAARTALLGHECWNLAGGYHHASRSSSEGFCIYNDIGITVDILRRENLLHLDDKILIIDVDAHHGNGNAYVFMEDYSVTILDIYNAEVYPNNAYTRDRVNINFPLKNQTTGEEYLDKLEDALSEIDSDYKLAFIVAGTDVLKIDSLGGLALTINDCAERDKKIADALNLLSIPYVFLGGGGYSKGSVEAITKGIKYTASIELFSV